MSDITISFDGSGGAWNRSPNDPQWHTTLGSWAFIAVGKGGAVVRQDSGTVSPCNSNMAELYGALHALRWAVSQQYRTVTLRGDSTFVINWLRGVNRTSTAPHLARLQYQIAQCISHLVIEEGNRRRIRPLQAHQEGRVILDPVHVPRSKNHFADKLTKEALKKVVAGDSKPA